jgi:CBS domain-containing protein
MRLEELKRIRVSELRRREPALVGEADPLIDVVRRMREKKRGAAVVVDGEGTLTGIFTERDVMVRVVPAGGDDWHARPVGDVMTRNPTCVLDTDPVARALKLMREGRFRHLPQVDAERRPVGIVSIRDVVVFVAENFPAEFLNLPPNAGLEATRRWGG